MGGDRKRGRTQRRHFNQGRENVWKHDSKKTKPEDSAAAAAAAAAAPDGANPSWQPFATRNTGFEEYYKMQGIVHENEWEEYVNCLQKPLPAAFRINSSGQFFKDIMFQLENDFVESLKAEVNDEHEVEAIRPLPWYPGKLAWHMNFSRMQLRKSKTLERFHEFLKQENEVGNITRQEAVSMVPPLFLNVLPDHYILDMCAAPGSKTFQLLEIIHQSTKPGSLPNGLVVANDVDVQRCNLLIHQTKRMCSANLIVTNHEGQHFPSCFSKDDDPECLNQEDELIKKSLQFDRVLCDVPCSGDGTLRKAPDIWRKWNAGMGNGLHRLQVEIAMRGISLLKVGGRMVYSTCSMNPVENEAVVAEILRRTGGSVELLDVSNELPELIRRPGLRTWKIKDRGVWLESYKDVTSSRRSVVLPSMFPSGLDHKENFAENDGQVSQNPENGTSLIHNGKTDNNLEDDSVKSNLVADVDLQTKKEVSIFPLEYCMRILPHDQNTGAFFIAVFQKLSSLPAIAENPIKPATKSNQRTISKCNQKLGIVCEDETALLKDVVAEDFPATGATPSDADLIVEQPTNDDGTVAINTESNDPESVEASGNSEVKNENIKEVKQKFQMQGKWRGVDPVVFFNDEATINSIRSFYGISDSFPLDGHLVTRNSDVDHVKRIYYISKSVHNVLHLNFRVGERLKITSVGLKVFERQSSKDGSPCSFRLSSEGLPLLLPYISKQILYATLTDFKHLLQYRTIKFADFVDANFGIKASNLILGCCIVVLNEENVAKDGIVADSSMIAIVCWRGRTNLSIMLSELDARELLERLGTSFGIQIDSKTDDTEDSKMEGINVTVDLDAKPLDASVSAE